MRKTSDGLADRGRDDGTPERLTITLPPPKMPGANSRTHWRVRHKAARHDRYVAATLALAEMRKCASWEPIRQAVVSVTWRGRGRLPDVDNIGGKTKGYIDGLTDAKVWADDSAIVSIRFTVERVRKPDQPHVVLAIEGV